MKRKRFSVEQIVGVLRQAEVSICYPIPHLLCSDDLFSLFVVACS